MSWTHDNPGAGDPSVIRHLAALRLSKSAEIQHALLQLSRTETDANSSAWVGEAQHTFVTALATTYPDLNTLEAGLRAQGGALHRYADALDVIQADQAQLTILRRDAEDELYTLRYTIGVTESEYPWSFTSDSDRSYYERQRDRNERKIRDAEAELATTEHRWNGLIDSRRAADRDAIAALTNEHALGKNWLLGATSISGATDAEFLALLNKLSPTDLRALLTGNPDLEARLSALKAKDVAPWWNRLDDDQQAALIGAIPFVIGNLGGVAYASRDIANRLVLNRRIKAAEKEQKKYDASLPLNSKTGGVADGVDRKDEIKILKDIQNALGATNSVPPRQLVSLDLTVKPLPLAAISVGDLDTAKYASYQVSGMFSSTKNMVNATNDAAALWEEQVKFSAFPALPGGSAVVAWIGYSSPDAYKGSELEHAQQGAPLLADALRDYRTTTDGTADRYLTVNAHSYGSTTAAIALTEPGVRVDAFAMYGSAGIARSVDLGTLPVPEGQLWAGLTPSDRLAGFGRNLGMRVDPLNDPDVTYFNTGGDKTDPLTGERMEKSKGHGEYLKPGSESLRNLALINLDKTGDVTSSNEPTELPHF